jgi:spermidine synthase
LDVIEIDPKITKIAKEHFRLETSAQLEIHHQDARVFLNTNTSKYDAIL